MAAKELHLGIRTRPFRRAAPVSPHVALRGVMPDSLAPHQVACLIAPVQGAYITSPNRHAKAQCRCHGIRPVSTNSTGPKPCTEDFFYGDGRNTGCDCYWISAVMRTSWFIPPTEWESLPPSPTAGGTIRAVRFGCTRTKRSPSFLEPASAVRMRASRRICRFPVAVGLRLTASFGG